MKTAKAKWMAILGISLLAVAAGLSPSHAVRSIQVTYPHQGVKLTIGDNTHVAWTVQGKPKGKVNVHLLRDGTRILTIAKRISVAQGTVGWTLSSNLSAGVYQIRVKTTGGDKVVKGLSDPFEIQPKTIPLTPQAYRDMQNKVSQRYDKTRSTLGQKDRFKNGPYEIQPKTVPLDPQVHREMQKRASQRYESSGGALGQKNRFQATMPPVEVDVKIISVKPIMDWQYKTLKQIDVLAEFIATDQCKLLSKYAGPLLLDYRTVSPMARLEMVLGPHVNPALNQGCHLYAFHTDRSGAGAIISTGTLNKGKNHVKFQFLMHRMPKPQIDIPRLWPPGPVEVLWTEYAGHTKSGGIKFRTCRAELDLHIRVGVGAFNSEDRSSFDSREFIVTTPRRENVWMPRDFPCYLVEKNKHCVEPS